MNANTIKAAVISTAVTLAVIWVLRKLPVVGPLTDTALGG